MVDFGDGSVTQDLPVAGRSLTPQSPTAADERRAGPGDLAAAVGDRGTADRPPSAGGQVCIVRIAKEDGQTRGWHCVDLPVELEQRSQISVLRRKQRSGLGQLSCSGTDAVPTES